MNIQIPVSSFGLKWPFGFGLLFSVTHWLEIETYCRFFLVLESLFKELFSEVACLLVCFRSKSNLMKLGVEVGI